MAAYNWLIILLVIFVFGMGYAATYDVIEELHTNYAYTDTAHGQMGSDIVWAVWKYLPVFCLFSLALYGFSRALKNNGDGWQ